MRLLDKSEWTGKRIRRMSDDQGQTDQQQTSSESPRLRAYRIRMLLLGFGVLLLSLFAGLAMSFYQWDRGSPFDTSTWDGHFNPISRATYGPLVFIVFAFPVTFPALIVLGLLVYFGLKKRSRWPLPVIAYLATGVLWILWLDGLWHMD